MINTSSEAKNYVKTNITCAKCYSSLDKNHPPAARATRYTISNTEVEKRWRDLLVTHLLASSKDYRFPIFYRKILERR